MFIILKFTINFAILILFNSLHSKCFCQGIAKVVVQSRENIRVQINSILNNHVNYVKFSKNFANLKIEKISRRYYSILTILKDPKFPVTFHFHKFVRQGLKLLHCFVCKDVDV